jgi:nicotinate-nucleotide--dimethylbenzimidazole phosphoribosyltransferase
VFSDSLPLDAVAFTADALLAPAVDPSVGDPARPGARRLVQALTDQGLRTPVIPSRGEEPGSVMALLTSIGFDPLPVLQPGPPAPAVPGQPDSALLQALASIAAPERILVVTGAEDPVRPDVAAHFAGAVSTGPDQPLAKAVLAWLSARVGMVGAAATLIAPLDVASSEAAAQLHLQLTKPPGSLGRVEDLGIQLAGISGQVPPPAPYPATVAIFAGDHGVHAQGVSPWPQEVTAQMVVNFLNQGAAINVLAHQVGAEVVVVDVGVAADLPSAQGLLERKLAYGTRDLALEPALDDALMWRALDIGAEVAAGLVAQGTRCLLTGDMGIANTTPSTALVVALTGRRAGDITGAGAGLDEAAVPLKATIVAEAAARARGLHGDNALGILGEVGGFEHAALVGYILAGAALGVPVVIDGVIAASALLVASRLVPGVEASAIAGHRSVERGSSAVLEDLAMQPVMDLDLRLGEGTGAVLALPVLDAATRIMAEMATFDQAGVSTKDQ